MHDYKLQVQLLIFKFGWKEKWMLQWNSNEQASPLLSFKHSKPFLLRPEMIKENIIQHIFSYHFWKAACIFSGPKICPLAGSIIFLKLKNKCSQQKKKKMIFFFLGGEKLLLAASLFCWGWKNKTKANKIFSATLSQCKNLWSALNKG